MFTVQYESLVREPEGGVRAVCQFLGLPYEARMLAEFGQAASRNVTHQERWKDDVRRGVLLDRHGVWRQRITPGQAWLIGRATAPVASRYGYAPPSAAAGSILAALLHEARERYGEARQLGGRVGAVRHALAAVKAVRPAPASP